MTTHRKPVEPAGHARKALQSLTILHEDDHLLVLSKPAGLAVHGGSGVSLGVIEALRAGRPEARFLELVHRLDRETSGVLLVACRRSALTALHAQLREGRTDKRYQALVAGHWPAGLKVLDAPLLKLVVGGDERKVVVSDQGQPSRTEVRCLSRYLDPQGQACSLVECRLRTGRTHQIRVHLQHAGFPILGDDRYGDFPLNRALAGRGLSRMFLHAVRMVCEHPGTHTPLVLQAPLPAELASYLRTLTPCTPEGVPLHQPLDTLQP